MEPHRINKAMFERGPIFTKIDSEFRDLIQTFESNIQTFRSELLELMGKPQTSTSSSFPSSLLKPEEAGLDEHGRWSSILLALNGQFEVSDASPPVSSSSSSKSTTSSSSSLRFACRLTPRTCDLLRQTPAAHVREGQSKFSLMYAGVHVRPHSGPSDTRLRMHCTLTLLNQQNGGEEAMRFRLGEKEKIWRDDQCFVFDETVEHEVIYRPARNSNRLPSSSSNPKRASFRAVLIIDIVNPFLESLHEFQHLSVSEEGWSKFSQELTEYWKSIRLQAKESHPHAEL
jgi:hypothetical protein